MGFFECIKTQFNHVDAECREPGQGYKVKTGSVGSCLIVKGDKILAEDKSCDCIIFIEAGNCLLIAIVELKGKPSSVGDIVEKFRNTSQLVTRMLNKCTPTRLPVEIFPILYHTGIGSRQKRELRKDGNRIRFSKERHRIIMKEYKVTLKQVISNFKAGS